MVSKSASLSIHDISAFSSAPEGHKLGLKFIHLSLLSPLLSNWYIYMLIDPLVVSVLAEVKLTTS